MSVNKLTMGRAAVGSLLVGSSPGNPDRPNSPVELRAIQMVSATIAPGDLTENTSYEATLDVTGLSVGDLLLPIPPSGLESGLVGTVPVVTASGVARMAVQNVSASTVDASSRTWQFLWISFYATDPDDIA